MIDTATIFFSTLMCLLVVFRAIRLDGQMPWFGKPRPMPGRDHAGQNHPGRYDPGQDHPARNPFGQNDPGQDAADAP